MTELSIIATQRAATQPAEADVPVHANRTPPEQVARLQAAAEQFESFFIAQMLRQMRSATREMASEDSVFNSPSSESMLDMADVALADSLATHRAFGVADAIVRQLLPAAPGHAPVPLASLPSPASPASPEPGEVVPQVKKVVRPVASEQ